MKYAKTNNGILYKVWSINTEDGTVGVYPIDEEFDSESTILKNISFKDIKLSKYSILS